VDPVGSSLITGSDDGKVRRFEGDHPDAPALVLGPFESGVRSLVLGPNRRLAAAFADGTVRVWDQGAAASLPPRGFAGSGPSLGALAVANHLLAAASTDGSLKIWNLERPGSPLAQFKGTQGWRVSSLAFSRNGNILAAGTQGGARLRQVANISAPLQPACLDRDVRSVAFSPDDKTLACGTSRGEIVLWDLAGGTATSLRGHASSVNSLSFNAQGSFLASASSDGTLRLWNLRNPGVQPIVLTGHQSWVWSATFTPDGDHLVSASADQTVRIWPARTDVLAGEICHRVHRTLTVEEWNRHLPPDLAGEAIRPCVAP
jgi:WD40 repeat protein